MTSDEMEKFIEEHSIIGEFGERVPVDDVRELLAAVVPRWVPVSEQTPEPYESVQVVVQFPDELCLCDGFHGGINGWHFYLPHDAELQASVPGQAVTHWMPLPPLPAAVPAPDAEVG